MQIIIQHEDNAETGFCFIKIIKDALNDFRNEKLNSKSQKKLKKL